MLAKAFTDKEIWFIDGSIRSISDCYGDFVSEAARSGAQTLIDIEAEKEGRMTMSVEKVREAQDSCGTVSIAWAVVGEHGHKYDTPSKEAMMKELKDLCLEMGQPVDDLEHRHYIAAKEKDPTLTPRGWDLIIRSR